MDLMQFETSHLIFTVITLHSIDKLHSCSEYLKTKYTTVTVFHFGTNFRSQTCIIFENHSLCNVNIIFTCLIETKNLKVATGHSFIYMLFSHLEYILILCVLSLLQRDKKNNKNTITILLSSPLSNFHSLL